VAWLDITLDGPLLVAGGKDASAGVHLATARLWTEHGEIPCIPATALRGALRLQLEALLRGAEEAATGPYPLDEGEGAPPALGEDDVAQLFGYCGRLGERHGSHEGLVRVSDALPADPLRAKAALAVRAGVSLEPTSGAAADQKLFFRELVEVRAEPLRFRAELDPGAATPSQLERLRAAVETVGAIGGGKASGCGEVSLAWQEGELPRQLPAEAQGVGDAQTAERARLVFTLLEPAHFGDGGPRRNHQATRTHVPGATVRGALAWALLRSGTVRGEDPAFQALFLGEPSFGDALFQPRPVGTEPEALAVPTVGPLPRERERKAGAPSRDRLARELARAEVNRRLEEQGWTVRLARSGAKVDPVPPRPGVELLRRTRTRVSIDRETGAAADRRLFSIEQIEPWVPSEGGDAPAARVAFVATIENLGAAGPEARQLLGRLAGHRVYLGAGRHHGLGAVALSVIFEPETPNLDAAEARVGAFAARVEALIRRWSAAAHLPPAEPGAAAGAGTVPLVWVAQSEYLPRSAEDHPLAGLFPAAPTRSWLAHAERGGYDQRPARARSAGEKVRLKPLCPAVAAGGVYVYEVPRAVLRELLERALAPLARGVGRDTQVGCGRFTVYELESEEGEERS
jgi:hypothetical protein